MVVSKNESADEMSFFSEQEYKRACPVVKFVCGKSYDYYHGGIRFGFYWSRVPYSEIAGRRTADPYRKHIQLTVFKPIMRAKLK